MKLKGIFGKGSGKLGSSVFVVSGGEQIVREHNPRVSNPNTEAQVSQRAKFKLLTQLAATLAPVIVIPKKGMTSARNQFVSKNFSIVENDGNTAQVEYEKLQITNGIANMAAVEAALVQGTGINVALETSMEGDVDRVIYALFKKTANNKLQFVKSNVTTNPGVDGKFAATLPETDSEAVIYAYGMRDNNDSAKARYNNYNVETGDDIATLIATRNLLASDYTFTETTGTTVEVD